MRDTDEEDDGYCGCVLFESHSDVLVKEWIPMTGSGEEDGEHHCAHGSNNGVEKGCKGEPCMSSLKLLNSFVEVNNAVQKGEDFSGESGHVAHRPVVSIYYGK